MVESSARDNIYSGSDNDHPPVRISLTGTPALVIVGICLIILCMGVVACMLFFIYLCFVHPDSANLLIPLLLAPIGGAAVLSGKKVADAITGQNESKEADKSDNLII